MKGRKAYGFVQAYVCSKDRITKKLVLTGMHVFLFLTTTKKDMQQKTPAECYLPTAFPSLFLAKGIQSFSFFSFFFFFSFF